VHGQIGAHPDVLGALAREQEAGQPGRRRAVTVVHLTLRRERLPGLDPGCRAGELRGQVVSVPGHDGQPGLIRAVEVRPGLPGQIGQRPPEVKLPGPVEQGAQTSAR
jgi:hypothetical protein